MLASFSLFSYNKKDNRYYGEILMISFVKKWISEHKSFVNYFLISCFVTVLDIAVSFAVEKGLLAMGLLEASKASLAGNACGVVIGFIVQYFLCTKKVYAGSNFKTLLIFFLTWLMGLGIAEAVIYVVRTLIFHDADGLIYFAIGKACSIAIPFFITYFIRKILIPEKESNVQKENAQ